MKTHNNQETYSLKHNLFSLLFFFFLSVQCITEWKCLLSFDFLLFFWVLKSLSPGLKILKQNSATVTLIWSSKKNTVLQCHNIDKTQVKYLGLPVYDLTETWECHLYHYLSHSSILDLLIFHFFHRNSI